MRVSTAELEEAYRAADPAYLKNDPARFVTTSWRFNRASLTVVPAQAAGVPEIAVVVPPTPFGGYNTDLLAACRALGVTEVHRIGGAQAVAALAYGVEGIAPVDKIVGPGNLFVALAKRQVYGEVDIDSIAGPSEIVLIADWTAEPRLVAADLISQARRLSATS